MDTLSEAGIRLGRPSGLETGARRRFQREDTMGGLMACRRLRSMWRMVKICEKVDEGSSISVTSIQGEDLHGTARD